MGTTMPKVFILYSWAQNKEHVLNLADRLLFDGVEVVIDEYDFKKSRWTAPIGGVETVAMPQEAWGIDPIGGVEMVE